MVCTCVMLSCTISLLWKIFLNLFYCDTLQCWVPAVKATLCCENWIKYITTITIRHSNNYRVKNNYRRLHCCRLNFGWGKRCHIIRSSFQSLPLHSLLQEANWNEFTFYWYPDQMFISEKMQLLRKVKLRTQNIIWAKAFHNLMFADINLLLD